MAEGAPRNFSPGTPCQYDGYRQDLVGCPLPGSQRCVVGSCMELNMAALGSRLDAVPPRLGEKAEGAPRNRTPGTPCQYNGSDNFFMIRTA